MSYSTFGGTNEALPHATAMRSDRRVKEPFKIAPTKLRRDFGLVEIL